MEETQEDTNLDDQCCDFDDSEDGAECRTAVAIVNLLKHRLDRENFLNPKDRESLAYRLSEVMLCAKDLYTKRLQCLTADTETRKQMGLLGEDTPPPDPETVDSGEAELSSEISVFDDLAYTRMHLIRLRDLISDFDGCFMEAMAAQREAEGNEETWLQDAEWNEEELGETAEDSEDSQDGDAWARSEE